jgi:hypothetical protein
MQDLGQRTTRRLTRDEARRCALCTVAVWFYRCTQNHDGPDDVARLRDRWSWCVVSLGHSHETETATETATATATGCWGLENFSIIWPDRGGQGWMDGTDGMDNRMRCQPKPVTMSSSSLFSSLLPEHVCTNPAKRLAPWLEGRHVGYLSGCMAGLRPCAASCRPFASRAVERAW